MDKHLNGAEKKLFDTFMAMMKLHGWQIIAAIAGPNNKAETLLFSKKRLLKKLE